jgi:DNA repair exonuclease SbcCD ATPase subunit
MTRLELIKLIGDVLTKLDVLRGSLLPNESNRGELDRLRKKLDKKQLQFSRNEFIDSARPFQQATAELEKIHKELRKTINRTEEIATTLKNLKRFVKAIDDIVVV